MELALHSVLHRAQAVVALSQRTVQNGHANKGVDMKGQTFDQVFGAVFGTILGRALTSEAFAQHSAAPLEGKADKNRRVTVQFSAPAGTR
jgi:hypothetical protein